MAKRSKHTTAFVMGTLLGGAAAAAAAVWNSPQSGEKTRQQISEKVESVLFTVLGAGESTMARVLTPESPAPEKVEHRSTGFATAPIVGSSQPIETEPTPAPIVTGA